MDTSEIALKFPNVRIDGGIAHIAVFGDLRTADGIEIPSLQTLPIQGGVVRGARLPAGAAMAAIALADMKAQIVSTGEVLHDVRAILPGITVGGSGPLRSIVANFRSIVTIRVLNGSDPHALADLSIAYAGMSVSTRLDASGQVSILLPDGEHNFVVGRAGLEPSAHQAVLISADAPPHLSVEMHLTHEQLPQPPPGCAI